MTVIPILKQKQVYGIYNPVTGKWSRGKCGPVWGNTPKTWTLGHLKNHLAQFVDRKYDWTEGYHNDPKVTIVISDVYKNCIIVDIGTNQEDPNLKIIDILRDKAVKEATERNRNYPIVEK